MVQVQTRPRPSGVEKVFCVVSSETCFLQHLPQLWLRLVTQDVGLPYPWDLYIFKNNFLHSILTLSKLVAQTKVSKAWADREKVNYDFYFSNLVVMKVFMARAEVVLFWGQTDQRDIYAASRNLKPYYCFEYGVPLGFLYSWKELPKGASSTFRLRNDCYQQALPRELHNHVSVFYWILRVGSALLLHMITTVTN